MPVTLDLASVPLRAVLRPAPMLAPEDSQARFVQLARSLATTALPVQRGDFLCGIVALADVLPTLEIASQAEREQALQRPVSEVMRPPVAVARPEMTLEEVGQLCARHALSLIPVVELDEYCLGVILASDLLVPEASTPRPAPIGGMATPFGVYLTNGTLQAGAGNLALMTTGFLLGTLMILSVLLVQGSLWLMQHYAHLPASPVFDLIDDSPVQQPWQGLLSLALRALVPLVFLLLLRATRVAGYHAAEHQTVHAIEREETLTPEIVGRMPRAHPRCGTNLVAAGALLFGIWQAVSYVPYLDALAPIFAAITTLFTWRTVGTFLQERFTTKPADSREIASGIAAGKDLLEKYLRTAPSRPRVLRRLWCMGMLQVLSGSLIAYSLAILIGVHWHLF